MTDDTNLLDEAVAHLARCKVTLDEYKPILDQLKSEMDACKEVIADYFAETGTERIRKHGVVIYASHRETRRIDDIAACKEVLDANGILDRYTTINTAAVIDELSSLPGISDLIRTTDSSTISVKMDTKGAAK